MKNNNHENSKETNRTVIWIRSIIALLIMMGITFSAAGRLDYWQGWVYNIMNIIFLMITMIILRDKPGLMAERQKPGKGMKQWDKVFFILSTPLFLIILVLSAFDAGRYGWSPQIPLYVYILATLLYILGQIIVLWAKYVNAFFSSVVRIQEERGHTVCQDGPYRFTRHPGYLGGILFTSASSLLLGSLWALIPVGVGVILTIIRTYLEDRTLQRELPGYVEYAKKVKYKLLPYLW